MNKRNFLYLRDPLFVFCFVLYFVNRWVIKPNCDVYFFHAWLNDLICIPFWVPIMLWAMTLCRLRRPGGPPQLPEIAIPLFFWSWYFEMYLPNTTAYGASMVADPWDIVAYTLGAVIAYAFWNYWYKSSPCEVMRDGENET